jgi:hypothetical protein
MLTERKKQASLGKTMTEILETAKAGTFEDLVEQRQRALRSQYFGAWRASKTWCK